METRHSRGFWSGVHGTRAAVAKSFWLAAAVSVLLVVTPNGRFLIYPFALLSTWAHEMGHGIAALLVGGEFVSLELYRGLGGIAQVRVPDRRVAHAIMSAGGLLGPAVAGGLAIVVSSRPSLARLPVYAVMGLLALSLVLWVRNPFGCVAILGILLLLGCVTKYGGRQVELSVSQFIGIQFCLGSLSDFEYMFTKEFVRDGQVRASDTQQIAQQLGLPYWFWGFWAAAISLAILTFAFRLAWGRRAKPGEADGRSAAPGEEA